MRHSMIFGLLAVAAVYLTAFVGSAFADTATSPTGTTYTSTVTASAEGHSVTHNPIAKVECASTFTFSVQNHGAGKPVSGSVSSMTTGPCTNDWHVTVVSPGTVSINNSSGGYNGTISSNGLTVEKTRLGITCRYKTENTVIGTATGGSPATIHVNGALPFHSGSFLCGSGSTTMTGSYTVTTPGSLYIDNN